MYNELVIHPSCPTPPCDRPCPAPQLRALHLFCPSRPCAISPSQAGPVSCWCCCFFCWCCRCSSPGWHPWTMVLVHLGQPRQPDQPSATVPARLGPTVPRSDELHVGTRPSNSRPTWLALQANHPQQPTSKARPCNDTLPSNGALLVPVSPLVPVLTLPSSFPLCIQPGAGLIRTGTHLNLCPPICPSSPASVSRDSPPCSFHHAWLGL